MSGSRHDHIVLDSSDGVNAATGGVVKRFKAGGNLLIGDAVYLSAADTVNKATGTAGNRLLAVGIVVGGSSYLGGKYEVAPKGMVGQAAASTNGYVHVLIHGIAYGIADGTITLHQQVQLGATTAGRLANNATSDATVITGTILGIALEAQTTTGAAFKVLVSKF
jgi:hypothetical protein